MKKLKKSEVLREGYVKGLQKARQILKEMVEPNSVMDDFIEEIFNHDFDDCVAYIENGFDVNTTDDRGRTILHWACDQGWDDFVLYLLNNTKINILKRDKRYQNAIQVAISNHYYDIADTLCDFIH